MLISTTISDLSGYPVNTEVPGFAMMAVLAGGLIWHLAGSWRDAKAIENGVAGNGPGLVEEYKFDARHAIVLVVIMLAIVAVDIAVAIFSLG